MAYLSTEVMSDRLMVNLFARFPSTYVLLCKGLRIDTVKTGTLKHIYTKKVMNLQLTSTEHAVASSLFDNCPTPVV